MLEWITSATKRLAVFFVLAILLHALGVFGVYCFCF